MLSQNIVDGVGELDIGRKVDQVHLSTGCHVVDDLGAAGAMLSTSQYVAVGTSRVDDDRRGELGAEERGVALKAQVQHGDRFACAIDPCTMPIIRTDDGYTLAGNHAEGLHRRSHPFYPW